MKCLSGPVHSYPNIFNPQLFLSGFKNFHVQTYPHSNRICQSTSIRHVSRFTLPLLWEYWQQSVRRNAREICILLCLERTWERGWHLNYSIHGKELSSILLRHQITKYPDLASTRFRIHGVFKNFLSGERIKKVADLYSGFTGYVWTEAVSGKNKLRIQKYLDTWGQGLKWKLSQVAPLKEGNAKSTS